MSTERSTLPQELIEQVDYFVQVLATIAEPSFVSQLTPDAVKDAMGWAKYVEEVHHPISQPNCPTLFSNFPLSHILLLTLFSSHSAPILHVDTDPTHR